MMEGTSLDIKADLLQKLEKLIPGAFREDKLDYQMLKMILGDLENMDNERYQISWVGKQDAYRLIQEPTTATLAALIDESLEWKNANNVLIEGDNLDVLKVLQKSYYGKVKAIMIDPPYNTGSDSFVYADRFSEQKDEYLKKTGSKDAQGFSAKESIFRENKKENGQFHSNWLSMMLPRLFLAKNLLREDGLIFIHIDDNELANLKLLMDEVFGESNKEAIITWRRRHNQPNDKSKMVSKVAEYILVYSKNAEYLKEKGTFYGLPLSESRQDNYTNPDNDARGAWSSKPWKVGSGQSGSRYTITTPTGKIYDESWMGAISTYNELLADGRIYFPSSGDGVPRKKFFLSERMDEGQCAHNFWNHQEFGSNQEASAELATIFNGKNIFDNPKPIRLLKAILKLSTKNDDIVMDFFGGSGSTAQAVMELNDEDGADRKFILIQLPEQIEAGEQAVEYGFDKISQITRSRIEKVIQTLNKERTEKIGFRNFKLTHSNFKIWRADKIRTDEELIKQLDFFKQPEKENANPLDIVWELVIKAGYPLTARIEQVNIQGVEFYNVENGKLYLCLDKAISYRSMEAIVESKVMSIICLDSIFDGRDHEKTNIIQLFADSGIEFQTI